MTIFSVIMPTYNQSDLLQIAIQSVINQTVESWELIVINNNSKDNTIEIIHSFEDKRIKTININNKGIIAASRNIGIKNAIGEYISFLDSDDFWQPEKLEEVLNAFNRGFDFVCHNESWKYEEKTIDNKNYKPSFSPDYKNILFHGNCFSTSAVSIRSSFVRKIDGFNENPNFIGVEDYDFWLEILKYRPNIFFIEKNLGTYLMHDSNTSRRIWSQFKAELSVLNSHFKSIRKKSLIVYLLIIRRYFILLVSFLKSIIY